MDFFKYCTLDNPVFFYSLFWIALFVVSGYFVLVNKAEEKQQAADAARDEAAAAKNTLLAENAPSKSTAAHKSDSKAKPSASKASSSKKSESEKAELIARNEKKRELVR